MQFCRVQTITPDADCAGSRTYLRRYTPSTGGHSYSYCSLDPDLISKFPWYHTCIALVILLVIYNCCNLFNLRTGWPLPLGAAWFVLWFHSNAAGEASGSEAQWVELCRVWSRRYLYYVLSHLPRRCLVYLYVCILDLWILFGVIELGRLCMCLMFSWCDGLYFEYEFVVVLFDFLVCPNCGEYMPKFL